jgi:hypothetical protein
MGYQKGGTGMTTDITSMDGMDFDEDPELSSRVKFKVAGDWFEGVDDLATELAMDFAGKVETLEQAKLTADQSREVMRDLLHLVLKPESAERFLAHMRDPAAPIGNKRLKKIIPWLFEQYAERPTTPDGDSSPSSENPEPGTKSLASTPPAELTSGESDSPISSTSSTGGSRKGPRTRRTRTGNADNLTKT